MRCANLYRMNKNNTDLQNFKYRDDDSHYMMYKNK